MRRLFNTMCALFAATFFPGLVFAQNVQGTDILVAPVSNPGFFSGFICGDGDTKEPLGWLDWSIGNSRPFSSTRTDDMVFSTCEGSLGNPTHWKERMRITKSGNVGIGTPNPSVPLEIHSATDYGATLILNKNSGFFVTENFSRYGVPKASIGLVPEDGLGDIPNDAFVIASTDGATWTNPLIIENLAPTGAVHIAANGNIGMGTMTANSKLTIQSPIRGDYVLNVGGANNAKMLVRHIDGKEEESSDVGELYLQYDIDRNTILNAESSGRVGIGTINPKGKLDVNGTIYQRGVRLHADYVFEPAYKLESIKDHAEFMWKKKHLKGIPRARADENGLEILDIGSQRRGIVEELEKAHIYIAQLEERLEELERRLRKME